MILYDSTQGKQVGGKKKWRSFLCGDYVRKKEGLLMRTKYNEKNDRDFGLQEPKVKPSDWTIDGA